MKAIQRIYRLNRPREQLVRGRGVLAASTVAFALWAYWGSIVGDFDGISVSILVVCGLLEAYAIVGVGAISSELGKRARADAEASDLLS